MCKNKLEKTVRIAFASWVKQISGKQKRGKLVLICMQKMQLLYSVLATSELAKHLNTEEHEGSPTQYVTKKNLYTNAIYAVRYCYVTHTFWGITWDWNINSQLLHTKIYLEQSLKMSFHSISQSRGLLLKIYHLCQGNQMVNGISKFLNPNL